MLFGLSLKHSSTEINENIIEERLSMGHLKLFVDLFYFILNKDFAFRKISPASFKFLRNFKNLFLSLVDSIYADKLEEISFTDYLKSSFAWLFLGLPYFLLAVPANIVLNALKTVFNLVAMVIAAPLALLISPFLLGQLIFGDGGIDNGFTGVLLSFFNVPLSEECGPKDIAAGILLFPVIFPIAIVVNPIVDVASTVINAIAAVGFTIATPVVGVVHSLVKKFSLSVSGDETANKDDSLHNHSASFYTHKYKFASIKDLNITPTFAIYEDKPTPASIEDLNVFRKGEIGKLLRSLG